MSGLDDLPEGTQIMLCRLVQECFNNVMKHSKAGSVALNVGRKRESFGLSGMKERVALLGGDIRIQSSRGKGTKVEIAIPT